MEVITNLTKYESFVMDYVAAKTVSGEWTDEDSANPVLGAAVDVIGDGFDPEV